MWVLVDQLIFLVNFSFKNVFSRILKKHNYKKVTTGTKKIIGDIRGGKPCRRWYIFDKLSFFLFNLLIIQGTYCTYKLLTSTFKITPD